MHSHPSAISLGLYRKWVSWLALQWMANHHVQYITGHLGSRKEPNISPPILGKAADGFAILFSSRPKGITPDQRMQHGARHSCGESPNISDLSWIYVAYTNPTKMTSQRLPNKTQTYSNLVPPQVLLTKSAEERSCWHKSLDQAPPRQERKYMEVSKVMGVPQ